MAFRRKPRRPAKLKPEDVILIRALKRERDRLKAELLLISQKAVAEKFGVAQSTISEAENGVYHTIVPHPPDD